jgi:hypothetical protein
MEFILECLGGLVWLHSMVSHISEGILANSGLKFENQYCRHSYDSFFFYM